MSKITFVFGAPFSGATEYCLQQTQETGAHILTEQEWRALSFLETQSEKLSQDEKINHCADYLVNLLSREQETSFLFNLQYVPWDRESSAQKFIRDYYQEIIQAMHARLGDDNLPVQAVFCVPDDIKDHVEYVFEKTKDIHQNNPSELRGVGQQTTQMVQKVAIRFINAAHAGLDIKLYETQKGQSHHLFAHSEQEDIVVDGMRAYANLNAIYNFRNESSVSGSIPHVSCTQDATTGEWHYSYGLPYPPILSSKGFPRFVQAMVDCQNHMLLQVAGKVSEGISPDANAKIDRMLQEDWPGDRPLRVKRSCLMRERDSLFPPLKKLVMVAGAPGIGKTTYLHSLVDDDSVCLYETDQLVNQEFFPKHGIRSVADWGALSEDEKNKVREERGRFWRAYFSRIDDNPRVACHVLENPLVTEADVEAFYSVAKELYIDPVFRILFPADLKSCLEKSLLKDYPSFLKNYPEKAEREDAMAARVNLLLTQQKALPDLYYLLGGMECSVELWEQNYDTPIKCVDVNDSNARGHNSKVLDERAFTRFLIAYYINPDAKIAVEETVGQGKEIRLNVTGEDIYDTRRAGHAEGIAIKEAEKSFAVREGVPDMA